MHTVSNLVLVSVLSKRLEHSNTQGKCAFRTKDASHISARILVQMLFAMVNDEPGTPA